MLLVLMLSFAFAGEELAPVDLDGDGVKEVIEFPVITEKNRDDDLSIKVGKDSISYFHVYPTGVTLLDLKTGDSTIEVRACVYGERDHVSCELLRYKKGKLEPVYLADKVKAEASMFTASGSGIVLAHSNTHRLYTKIDKYILGADGFLKLVPQPYYVVNTDVKIDRTFPVTISPGGGDVVANVRPGSEIKVLLTDGKDNFLFALSSGITGWASYQTLTKASDYIRGIEMAG
jgi:hypothetical protein